MRDSITKKTPGVGRRDFLKELGVRPVINGAGTYTMFTGTLMRPEALQAMESISQRFVRIDELHDAIGRRIASLLDCDAAMVTSGAFGSLTVGTAACMTGTNAEFIQRLPDTAGMKHEVIIQRSHRFPYDHAVRNCGVRLIEVETRGELERTIGSRTAMMLFLNKAEPAGHIGPAEFVQLGRKHRVPTFNDAAADVPPVDNLFKYTKVGFDLVAFSGGKGICGPQGAGLLLGRGDLIEAARLNTGPHSDTIGRGLKVSKEEMVAMMVALELYLARDHEADWREWEARVELIRSSLSALKGVTVERYIPAIANQIPHLCIRWDQQIVGISPSDVIQRLREGDPSIELIPVPSEKDSLEVAPWTLLPGDAEIVAERLRRLLERP